MESLFAIQIWVMGKLKDRQRRSYCTYFGRSWTVLVKSILRDNANTGFYYVQLGFHKLKSIGFEKWNTINVDWTPKMDCHTTVRHGTSQMNSHPWFKQYDLFVSKWPWRHLVNSFNFFLTDFNEEMPFAHCLILISLNARKNLSFTSFPFFSTCHQKIKIILRLAI